MDSIEERALQRYTKNIAYLQTHQKDVYDKIAAFDSAVENQHYTLKYDLIYSDGYFDVVELANGNKLYGSSSELYAQDAKESVNFIKSSNAYELFKPIHINKEHLNAYASMDVVENNLSAIAPILSFIQESKSHSDVFKQIPKFVFFGVGLGTHLESIHTKILAREYLIVEDDLELFKLSLFVTSYDEMAKNATLHFAVFTQEREFEVIAKKFIEDEFFYNHYIKYFQMLNQNDTKLLLFHRLSISQSHNLFYYSDILKQYTRVLEHIKAGYNILNIVGINQSDFFQDKNFLLLAPGPSLGKNIELVKKQRDKFTLVALSSALSILQEHGIRPDIVTHIDSLDTSVVHFTKLKSLDFLQNTLFLLSAKTPTQVLEMLEKKHIFLFENGTSYKKDFGSISAPCVGSTTFLLLLLLKPKELYLLGLDLALDTKTGATHSSGHEYAKKIEIEKSTDTPDTLSYKKSTLKVRGNIQDEVITTIEYKKSLDSIEGSIREYKEKGLSLYNLSDGVKIEGSITLGEGDNIQTNSYTSSFDALYRVFEKNASNTLNSFERKALDEKKGYITHLKNLAEQQLDAEFENELLFLESLKSLYATFTHSSSLVEYDISLVFENYFKLIYTFIFDFFNAQGIEHTPEEIQSMNKLLMHEVLRMVQKYEESLG